jgi:hypothetical protein
MIKLRKSSVQNCEAALRRAGNNARRGATRGVFKAGQGLMAAVKENMSLTDHTQADLTRLDHPYAARHPEIQIHQGSSGTMRDTSKSVHKQTGDLLSSINGGVQTDATTARFRLAADSNKVKYAEYVFVGTKKMHGRNVFAETAYATEVSSDIKDTIVSAIVAAVKG